MNGRRENDTSITLGEVYRLVETVKEEHGKKLDQIEEQVKITNGRTTTLEAEMRAVKEDVREIKPILVAPPVPVMTPEGESLSVKVSAKMWLGIAAAGGAALAAGTWVAGLIDKLSAKP